MEIGMSNVELMMFGLMALLVVVVAAVARRGQAHLRPYEARDGQPTKTATPTVRRHGPSHRQE